MFHVKRRPTRDLRGSVQRAHGSRAHRRSSARRGWSEGRDEETCGASSLARASALGRGGLNGTAPDARSVTRSLTLLGCYRATVTAYCPGTRCQAVDSRHPGSPCLPTSATQICCPRPGSPHDEIPRLLESQAASAPDREDRADTRLRGSTVRRRVRNRRRGRVSPFARACPGRAHGSQRETDSCGGGRFDDTSAQ